MPTLSPKLHRLLYTARAYSWLVDPRRFIKPPALPIDRPIFLLGTQGGGLTLLSRMLRRAPDVISIAGNHRYWTASDEMQNTFGMTLPPEFSGIRYKAPPHPKFPFPRSWSYACDELLDAYRKTERDCHPDLAEALKDVIRFAGLRHAHDRQHFRLLDKSQSFTVRVGLLHKALEGSDPKFVLVPRNPYVSVLRAARGKPVEMARLKDTIPYRERVVICAQHFANSMNAALDDCDRLGIPLHILTFEDLLKDPVPRVKEVCQFTELPFSDAMIPSAEDRLPLGSRYLDRWFPLKQEINHTYWHNMDDFVLETVNQYCPEDLLQRLGYNRVTSSEKGVAS